MSESKPVASIVNECVRGITICQCCSFFLANICFFSREHSVFFANISFIVSLECCIVSCILMIFMNNMNDYYYDLLVLMLVKKPLFCCTNWWLRRRCRENGGFCTSSHFRWIIAKIISGVSVLVRVGVGECKNAGQQTPVWTNPFNPIPALLVKYPAPSLDPYSVYTGAAEEGKMLEWWCSQFLALSWNHFLHYPEMRPPFFAFWTCSTHGKDGNFVQLAIRPQSGSENHGEISCVSFFSSERKQRAEAIRRWG